MYNKLFTKILDSSIWLEPSGTRIIWLTMIAAMDENGFVQFASVANLAHRARIELAEAQAAVDCLEGPDANSSDPEHEGRRIERVPGGWMILNAEKYREMVTRAVIQEKTRQRVAKHREKKKACNAPVTLGNTSATQANASVTQSDTDTDSATNSESEAFQPKEHTAPAAQKKRGYSIPECFAGVDGFDDALQGWIDSRKQLRKPATDHAVQLMLGKLSQQPGRAIAALNKCILSGWQGFEWAWMDGDRNNGTPAKPAASYYLPGVGMVNAK
jgi:hypothetical protein